MFIKPELIEQESLRIIESEMDKRRLDFYSESELKIVKRCIHTSADFDYQYNLIFSKTAVQMAFKAIKDGALIVCDTTMAAAGMNKKVLADFNSEVKSFIADEDVAAEALEKGVTRSAICMEKAARLSGGNKRPVILAVGNAPTALIRLHELISNQEFIPDLIIGTPVGFVNVVESKELILAGSCPYIVSRGRKGGSNIAACIINSIIYQIREDR